MDNVNEKTINNVKQNKIKYLVKDLAEYGVPEEVTREILLKRGVNKWLANRMAIIGLKDELKKEIKNTLAFMKVLEHSEICFCKLTGKKNEIYRKQLGRLQATEEIRKRIRSICHSSRWVFPE
jgi:hypothetical protein